MSEPVPFHDALHRLAQVGSAAGVRLVRITQLVEKNLYLARPVEFDENGYTQFVGTDTMTVTNLAEPADSDGQLPPDTEAVAVDVEGRWVVFVRQSAAMFVARVIDSLGSAAYQVREQVATGPGTFCDKTGAADVTACNLAELSLGPGAAVEDDAIVLVTILRDTGTPPVLRYVFDHPAYAKYLD